MSQPLWLVLAIVSAGIVLLPCPWRSRFTIWVYGLGLPCLAAVRRSWTGRFSRSWVVACAAVAFLEAGIVVARWQVPLRTWGTLTMQHGNMGHGRPYGRGSGDRDVRYSAILSNRRFMRTTRSGSEYGRLRHGDGDREGGNRYRTELVFGLAVGPQ